MQVYTSHNTMNVFFSGTDLNEIRDNSEHHNYYLSLIVNNKGETCAKIASRGELEENKVMNFTYTSEDGKMRKGNLKTNKKRPVVFFYDCDIQTPETTVDKWFNTRVEEILVEEEKKKKNNGFYGGGTQGSFRFFDEREDRFSSWDTFNGEAVPKAAKVLNERERVIGQFLNSWIGGEKGTLSHSLEVMNKKFNSMGVMEWEYESEKLTDGMFDCFEDVYCGFFDDPGMRDINETLDECIDVMNQYTEEYPIADAIYVGLVGIKEERQEEIDSNKKL